VATLPEPLRAFLRRDPGAMTQVAPRVRRERAGAPRRIIAIALLASAPLAAVPWRQRERVAMRAYGQPSRPWDRAEVYEVRSFAPAWRPPPAGSRQYTDWFVEYFAERTAPRVDWPRVVAWWGAVGVAAAAWGSGRRAATADWARCGPVRRAAGSRR
jgi:hypothetical protein